MEYPIPEYICRHHDKSSSKTFKFCPPPCPVLNPILFEHLHPIHSVPFSIGLEDAFVLAALEPVALHDWAALSLKFAVNMWSSWWDLTKWWLGGLSRWMVCTILTSSGIILSLTSICFGKLTPQECQCHFDKKLCLVCGQSGHIMTACLKATKASAESLVKACEAKN